MVLGRVWWRAACGVLCDLWCVVGGVWHVALVCGGVVVWHLLVGVCVASALLGWRVCVRVVVLGCVLVASGRVGSRWLGLCWVRVGFRFVWLRRADAACVAVASAIPPPADPPFPSPNIRSCLGHVLPRLNLVLSLLRPLMRPSPYAKTFDIARRGCP